MTVPAATPVPVIVLPGKRVPDPTTVTFSVGPEIEAGGLALLQNRAIVKPEDSPRLRLQDGHTPKGQTTCKAPWEIREGRCGAERHSILLKEPRGSLPGKALSQSGGC